MQLDESRVDRPTVTVDMHDPARRRLPARPTVASFVSRTGLKPRSTYALSFVLVIPTRYSRMSLLPSADHSLFHDVKKLGAVRRLLNHRSSPSCARRSAVRSTRANRFRSSINQERVGGRRGEGGGCHQRRLTKEMRKQKTDARMSGARRAAEAKEAAGRVLFCARSRAVSSPPRFLRNSR